MSDVLSRWLGESINGEDGRTTDDLGGCFYIQSSKGA